MILALMLLLMLPLQAISQKKQTTTSPQKRPTPKPKITPTPTPTPNLRPDAAQVAEQLKLITRFIYVYGKISNGLETADDQVKRGQTNQALQAQNQQIKASVVTNIDSLRLGLEKLEQSFQANPQLDRYYAKLAGASQAATNAAQLAAANRFDEAGRVLLGVAERLADVLVELR